MLCSAMHAEHFPQDRHRRVLAAAGTGLQDDRDAGFVCRLDIGAGIFPTKHDEPGNRVATGHRRLQDLRQRGCGHLNFAIMSLMPGIVSICQAWAGWKNWISERWERPPRMVK